MNKVLVRVIFAAALLQLGTDAVGRLDYNFWLSEAARGQAKAGADGKILDPYKMLTPMLEGFSQEELEQFVDEEGIRNGGTAMMAWAKLQFTETTVAEEQRIRKELLQYCELDTFAMVLIVEAWRSQLPKK